MMYFGLGWLGMLLSSILWIGFLVLLILLIVRLVRGPRRWHMHGHEGDEFMPGWGQPHNKALDILAERYAKGEISEEEYKKMKENLTR
jgi:putative membrane protein